GDREGVAATDFGHLHGLNALRASNSNRRMRGCTQKIAVETRLLRKSRLFFQVAAGIRKFDKLRHLSPPTQGDRHGIVGVTRGHKRRNDELSSHRSSGSALFIERDLQQIARFDAKLFRVSRTGERSVVASQLWARSR